MSSKSDNQKSSGDDNRAIERSLGSLPGPVPMIRDTKFSIGQLVKHRVFPFRGVIFDVDPEFANSEEWYASIPEEIRPKRDQPFYHLFAENAESEYIAYVSEQNLLADDNREPVRHPQISEIFVRTSDGDYRAKDNIRH